MRYFFVDTENIGEYNFIEEKNVTSNDAIVLFVSENSRRIKLEDLRLISMSGAKIVYEDVYTGDANALDFQLIASMSLMIANSNEYDEYIVVSNDNDYRMPVKYLAEKTKRSVSVLKTKASTLTECDKVNIAEALSEVLEETLAGDVIETSEDVNLKEEVLKIIEQSKALNMLHNNLRSRFGNDGQDIYKKIRPHIKSLYKV